MSMEDNPAGDWIIERRSIEDSPNPDYIVRAAAGEQPERAR